MDIVQILLAFGGTAGAGALLTAIWSRRKILAEASKTGVDAAQVLSAASIALLKPMQDQLTIMGTQLTMTQGRADTLDARLTESNEKVETTKASLKQCESLVNQLRGMLEYYEDKYGPPPTNWNRV